MTSDGPDEQQPEQADTSLRRPIPVGVCLDPSTTALLVMDITDPLCMKRPDCIESVPRIASLLAAARQAGARVVYTVGPRLPSIILDPVAPLDSEPMIIGKADKFFGTELDKVLKESGASTLVMVGTAANGAVMYTAYAANLRGYTVVVAADAISADHSETVDFVLWQLVNQPAFANPTNDPLMPARVTVSATDVIEFGKA